MTPLWIGREAKVHLIASHPGIDVAETLSCLTGKWISASPNGQFEDGSSASLNAPGNM
jgi:hypothetical protein